MSPNQPDAPSCRAHRTFRRLKHWLGDSCGASTQASSATWQRAVHAATLREAPDNSAWDEERPRTRVRRPASIIGAGPAQEAIGAILDADDLLIEQTQVPRILIVDVSPALRSSISLLLMREGYDVLTASSDTNAVDRAREWKPDVVLVDLNTADAGRLETLEACRTVGGKATPLFAIASDTLDMRGMRADHVFSKPLDVDELLRVLKSYTRMERAGDSPRWETYAKGSDETR